MKFVTIFLTAKNVDLIKDVGMVPYTLKTEYGFESSLVTYYKSEKFTYAEKEVKELNIEFIKKKVPGRFMDGISYLIQNGKKIDVLNLFHVSPSSFLWSIIYRIINKKGIIYLKLDLDYPNYNTVIQNNIIGWYKQKIIKMADIVSVESTILRDRIQQLINKEVLYIPDCGCDILSKKVELPAKENILVTVGRIGTEQKATDVLLEAFARTAALHSWKLQIIGSIEKEFVHYIKEFFLLHPELKERIEFIDNIEDRKKLQERYSKAKIFILPSRWESFGIVLTEAMNQGCYIITTDQVPSAYDMIEKGKYGTIIESDNIEVLADCICKECNSEKDWDILAYHIATYSRTKFNWKDNLRLLNKAILDRI